MNGPFTLVNPVFEYILQNDDGQDSVTIDFSTADNGSCGFDFTLSNPDNLVYQALSKSIMIDTIYDPT